jgi:hypothetical protein
LMLQRGFGAFVFPNQQHPGEFDVYRDEQVSGEDGPGAGL